MLKNSILKKIGVVYMMLFFVLTSVGMVLIPVAEVYASNGFGSLGGTVSRGSAYYISGQLCGYYWTANPNSGFQYDYWSGSYFNQSGRTVVIGTGQRATAHFRANAFNAPTLTGSPSNGHQNNGSVWSSGTTNVYNFWSPSPNAGWQYSYTTFSGCTRVSGSGGSGQVRADNNWASLTYHGASPVVSQIGLHLNLRGL